MKFDINSILEKFNQLDFKIRCAVFVVFLLAVFSLDFFTIIAFQVNSLQGMDNDSQVLTQNIQQLTLDLQTIDQLKKGLKKTKSQFEEINAKIHQAEEVPAVLEDISRMASNSGVKIDRLTPQPEIQKNTTSTKPKKYYLLPIVIQATSGYHMFGHFLNQLESGKVLFTLSSLTIEGHGDAQSRQINAVLKVVLSDANMDSPKK